jgi:hypothetical protein
MGFERLPSLDRQSPFPSSPEEFFKYKAFFKFKGRGIMIHHVFGDRPTIWPIAKQNHQNMHS